VYKSNNMYDFVPSNYTIFVRSIGGVLYFTYFLARRQVDAIF